MINERNLWLGLEILQAMRVQDVKAEKRKVSTTIKVTLPMILRKQREPDVRVAL